jgi:hypothetical protein
MTKHKKKHDTFKVWAPQFDDVPISIKLTGLRRRRLVAWDEFGQAWLFNPDERVWRAL